MFHISKYEEAIKDNSFYSYLKDAGKKELRSLLNSYEKHVADNAKLDGWEAKAAVAKEAGISPGIYALFQVALQEADTDGKGLPKVPHSFCTARYSVLRQNPLHLLRYPQAFPR